FFSEGDIWDERMDPWFELNTSVSALPVAQAATKPLGPFGQAFLRIANDTALTGSLQVRLSTPAGGSTGRPRFLASHLAISSDGIRLTPLGAFAEDMPA